MKVKYYQKILLILVICFLIIGISIYLSFNNNNAFASTIVDVINAINMMNVPQESFTDTKLISNSNYFTANPLHHSKCVTVIEKGAFDGIENVIIKTPYQTKPEGWADGWNNGLPVEWNAEIRECPETKNN